MTIRILSVALLLVACSKPEPPAPPPPPPPAPAPVAAVIPDAGSDAGDAAVDAAPEVGIGSARRVVKKMVAPAHGSGSGGFKVEGKLGKEDVEKVVRASMPKLRACYTAAHAKAPNLKGRVLFKLTVDHRGSVALGEVVTSTLEASDPEMCMVQAARDFRFPKSDGESTVGFQMNFK